MWVFFSYASLSFFFDSVTKIFLLKHVTFVAMIWFFKLAWIIVFVYVILFKNQIFNWMPYINVQIFSNYNLKPSIDGCDLQKFVKFFVIIGCFISHQSLITGHQVWLLHVTDKLIGTCIYYYIIFYMYALDELFKKLTPILIFNDVFVATWYKWTFWPKLLTSF